MAHKFANRTFNRNVGVVLLWSSSQGRTGVFGVFGPWSPSRGCHLKHAGAKLPASTSHEAHSTSTSCPRTRYSWATHTSLLSASNPVRLSITIRFNRFLAHPKRYLELQTCRLDTSLLQPPVCPYSSRVITTHNRRYKPVRPLQLDHPEYRATRSCGAAICTTNQPCGP